MDKYKAGFKFAMGMIFKHDFHKRECSDNTISCCLYILVSLKLCLKAMYIVAGQTLFKTISRQSYFGSHVSVSTRDQIVCFVTVNFQRALYQIHRTFPLKLPLFFSYHKKSFILYRMYIQFGQQKLWSFCSANYRANYRTFVVGQIG